VTTRDVPAPATHWPTILLTAAAGTVAAFHVGKVPPALPELRAELGLGLVLAGWVLALLHPIGAATGTTVGWFADRAGHRRTILAGLLCLAAGSALGALSGGGGMLLASRTLEGGGLIMTVVSAPGLILAAARPADMRLAFGIWGGYMPAGTAAMMAASPPLLATVGWRGTWIAAAMLTAAVAAALARVVPRRPAGRAGTALPLGRALLLTARSRRAWLLAGSFCLYSMSFMTVFGFLPSFLVEEQGWSTGTAALLTALAVAANVGGNLAAGWLAQRGVPRWTLLASACLVMGIASFGIFAPALDAGARYALCLLFSAVGGLLPATVMGSAADAAARPDLVASTSGLFVQGSTIGQLVGPPALATLVTAAGSWEAGAWLIGAAAAGGLAIAAALRGFERPATA
jgi:cyanate permease